MTAGIKLGNENTKLFSLIQRQLLKLQMVTSSRGYSVCGFIKWHFGEY